MSENKCWSYVELMITIKNAQHIYILYIQYSIVTYNNNKNNYNNNNYSHNNSNNNNAVVRKRRNQFKYKI